LHYLEKIQLKNQFIRFIDISWLREKNNFHTSRDIILI
jgi:hypothetical protein